MTFIINMRGETTMNITVEDREAEKKLYLLLQLGANEALTHDALDIESFTWEWFNLATQIYLDNHNFGVELSNLFNSGVFWENIISLIPDSLSKLLDENKSETIEMLRMINQDKSKVNEWLDNM